MAEEAKPQQTLADKYDLEEPFVATPPAAAAPSPPAPPPSPSSTPARDERGRFAKHPKRLVALAHELGLSDDDIESYTPEQLAQDIDRSRAERLFMATSGANYRPHADQPRDPTSQPPAPAEGNLAGPPRGGDPSGAETFGITEGEYNANIARLAKAVEDLLAWKRAIGPQVSELRGFHQEHVRQTLTQQADAAFSRREDVFGKGGFGDVAKGSPEMARREAVVALVKGFNDKQTPLGQQIVRATDILFGAVKAAGPAPEPMPSPPAEASMEDAWRQGAVARPTSRLGSTEPKGIKLAKQTFLDLEAQRLAAARSNGSSDDKYEF